MPVIFWDAALYAIVEALSSVAVALLIWYGGGEITRGALTFGVLVAFIQYIEKFFTPIRDLSAKIFGHAGRHGGIGAHLCASGHAGGTG